MTYLDFDVLELNYNRAGAVQEDVDRQFALLDPGTGVRTPVEQWTAPAPVRPFTWHARGRAEIALMLAFLDARCGRAVPFWFTTYQWDLTLAADVGASAAAIDVLFARYTEQMFGTTGARRHIALWTCGIGAMQYHRVTGASDPEDGTPETLTLDPVTGLAYPAATTVVSFLKLCRLESDEVTIRWLSPLIARATIAVREIPLEAPL